MYATTDSNDAPIDRSYRQEMIEAAGVEPVRLLTARCLDQSRTLLEGHRSQMTNVVPITASDCHKLAGSCAAVGLRAMAQAWYDLERLLARAPEAGGVDASALTAAWNLAATATRRTEQVCAQEAPWVDTDTAQTASSR